MEVTIPVFDQMEPLAKKFAEHVRDIDALISGTNSSTHINTMLKYKEAVVDLFMKECQKFFIPRPTRSLEDRTSPVHSGETQIS